MHSAGDSSRSPSSNHVCHYDIITSCFPAKSTSRAPRGCPRRCAMLRHLGNVQLLATLPIGFGTLFHFIATFHVSFRLAAPPYGFSSALLGLIFVDYLAGAWSPRGLGGSWLASAVANSCSACCSLGASSAHHAVFLNHSDCDRTGFVCRLRHRLSDDFDRLRDHDCQAGEDQRPSASTSLSFMSAEVSAPYCRA